MWNRSIGRRGLALALALVLVAIAGAYSSKVDVEDKDGFDLKAPSGGKVATVLGQATLSFLATIGLMGAAAATGIVCDESSEAESGQRFDNERARIGTVTGAIIPFYRYPDNKEWPRLMKAIANSGRPHSMYVVLNSNNGIVNGGPSREWQTAARNVKAAGGKVLVYINTCSVDAHTISNGFDSCEKVHGVQGGGNPKAIKSYLENWIKFLGDTHGNLIDGVFLDDTPTGNAHVASNVVAIAKAIRSLPGMRNTFIVANQGWNAKPRPEVLRPGVVDVSVQQENSSKPGSSNVANPEQAAIILHHVSPAHVIGWAREAGSTNYGYYYATSGAYSVLPSNIDGLLKCIGGGPCV